MVPEGSRHIMMHLKLVKILVFLSAYVYIFDIGFNNPDIKNSLTNRLVFMEMTFHKIFKDDSCNCLKDAFVDDHSSYCKKCNYNYLRECDFRSKWEKQTLVPQNCKEICLSKGVSIHQFNDENRAEIRRICSELFPLAPGYRPYIIVIRFYESSGMVKFTPNNKNIYHCTFFKSDEFDFHKVEKIESIEIKNV
jgi:hypothetical protein